jgi:hypothetical protein
MVIPGYDPEDLDDILESRMDAHEIETFLTDAQWESYRNDDETLVDLLDDEELHELVRTKSIPVDQPEEGS